MNIELRFEDFDHFAKSMATWADCKFTDLSWEDAYQESWSVILDAYGNDPDLAPQQYMVKVRNQLVMRWVQEIGQKGYMRKPDGKGTKERDPILYDPLLRRMRPVEEVVYFKLESEKFLTYVWPKLFDYDREAIQFYLMSAESDYSWQSEYRAWSGVNRNTLERRMKTMRDKARKILSKRIKRPACLHY